MGRHVRQQVKIDLGAVGKRESLPIGVHSRDLVFRVVRDAPRCEQLCHRAGDVGPSDAHWRRLGGVEFDLHAIAKALSAERVVNEHRALVRRRRTLVGGRCREDHDATRPQIPKGTPK